MFTVVCARHRRHGTWFYRHYEGRPPIGTPYSFRVICVRQDEVAAVRIADELETRRRAAQWRRRERPGGRLARVLQFTPRGAQTSTGSVENVADSAPAAAPHAALSDLH